MIRQLLALMARPQFIDIPKFQATHHARIDACRVQTFVEQISACVALLDDPLLRDKLGNLIWADTYTYSAADTGIIVVFHSPDIRNMH